MRRVFLLTSLILISGAMGARSEETKGTETNPLKLADSIIVTAKRTGAELKNVIWPVAIVKPNQLGTAATLAEKLDGVAGVDIRQYSGIGSVATLSSWGMFNRHMLLLYDGRIVRDLYLGGFNLSEYSADEFERIEIVKGPQSAFYGSDAVGGVVNLISRNSLSDRLNVAGRFGSFGQKSIRVNISRQIKPNRFGLSGFAQFSNSDNHRDNSGTESRLLGLRTDYLSNDGQHHITLSTRYFKDSLGVPGPVPDINSIPVFGNQSASSLTSWQEDKNFSTDLVYTYQPDDKTRIAMNLFWERKKLHYFTQYNMAFGESVDVRSHSFYNERVGGVSGRLQKTFSSFDLSGGVDMLSASLRVLKSDTTVGATSESVTGSLWASPQTQWDVWGAGGFRAYSWIRIDLSGRVQMIKSRDNQPSYNLGLVITPSDQVSARLGYGFAFRAPSFDQQFAVDAWYSGNPNVSPETSRSLVGSIGINQLGGAVAIQLSLFHQTVDSLIQFFSDPITWQTLYVNVDKFKTTGLDISISGHLFGDTRFSLSGVFQKAEQTTGEPGTYVSANYVPDLKWRAESSGPISQQISWNANLTYTSDRNIILFDGQPKTIRAVYELGAGLSVELSPSLSLALSGQDLTDQARPDQFGFTATDGDYISQGRRFLFEMSWGLR